VREIAGQEHHNALVRFLGDRAALLNACRHLTMLVTSREPLQLRREQVVQVPLLPVSSGSRTILIPYASDEDVTIDGFARLEGQ